ncbi:flavodoxin domain-containing protein [Clostridium nigeriense]|uniref:flavodoxin domain-containing protein n=1 Tax=Clostridium nigeriense TaxID=1805470 RepID=UPI003D35020F
MNALIAYSSKYGCTKKCVDLLHKELNGNVDIINLQTSKNIELSKYDKVIIGGSIYMGMIQKEVKEFCNNNLEILKGKQIGLFICGMQKGQSINTEINENFPKELLEISIVKEHFGGEFTFSKMKFFEKMIVKMISKTSSDKSNILKDNINKFALEMNSI